MAASGSLKTTAYDNRYLEFTWSEKGQSIDKNQTVISYTLKGGGSAPGYYQTRNIKLGIDGQTVFSTGTTPVSLYNGTVVASGEFTITHDADGTRDFTVTVEAGIYVWAVNCTGSDTFTLNAIPRASTLTAYNGSLNAEHTLTINRAASTFKHRLTYRCGDVADYILGGPDSFDSQTTAVKWTAPLGLAHENTTGTSVTVTFTLYTYASDGTHVGTTTKVITCAIPVSVVPSCSFTWEDTTGAADLYGNPVQGISKLKIKVKGVTTYSSPIALYTVSANSVKYNEAEVTTEALKKAGSNKITATVKDQRGRTGSSGQTLTVLAYTAPVVSKLAVHRCNEDGTENDQGNFVKATFSAAITNLAGKNPTNYVLKYKPSGSTQYTEVELTELASTYTVTDFSYIFAADANKSYDVEVTATDNHGTAARATSASTAFTLLNWHPSGTGMGVGKVSEKENAVEFGLDLYDKNDDRILGVGDLVDLFLPVGSMVLRYDTKNPGTIYPGTTWTQITARVLRAVNAGGTIGTEGSIADGSGRTYIDVAVWRRTK